MVSNKTYRDKVIKPVLSTSHASRSEGKVTRSGLSWMNRFLHQLIHSELKEKGGAFSKRAGEGGTFLPSLSAWAAPGWVQQSRIGTSKQAPAQLHYPTSPPKGCRDPAKVLPTHTQVLCPHNLLSAMDLQHGDGLCQFVGLLLLSKPLIYLANAMTNDEASAYPGLFVTSCGVNVLGKQRLIPPSANKMAFLVVFTGRAHFLWVSLLWHYWEMFRGRYLHSAEFLWHPPSAFDTGLGPRLPEDERALCTAPYQFVVLTEWRDYFSMAGTAD